MDDIDLAGRVAIVTGGGGGLGSAYCRELASRGAAVVVNDLGGSTRGEGRSTSYSDAVVEEICAAGGRAIANYDTVATMQGGASVVEAALTNFGRVDIVIANAGNQRNGRFEELSEEDFDEVYAVHVKGAISVVQPAYRVMSDQRYGRIVLVSSQSGIFGNPYRANYGSAKTALIGLMNVIAQESPQEILVNCILPNASGGRLGGGPLETRPDRDFLIAAGERSKHYQGKTDVSFVAALVTYLCSDRCTSSQNVYSVLGGRYARAFVGVTRGWCAPGSRPPRAEEIAERIHEIDDRTDFDVPLSGLAEMDTVVTTLSRQDVP